MPQLRHIILLSLCVLCLLPVKAQKRYSASEQPEYEISKKRGVSTREVENKTDALFGTHTSLYAGSHHLLGFSLEGGWSAFVNTMPKVSMLPGGGTAGLHLLYEYQYSGFILQTGLGVAYQRVFNNIADTAIYHEHMIDSWNGKDTEFTLKHLFTGRQDMSQQVYGQVPFYLGHYIFGSQGIGYFLAGIQASYAFWGTTQQKLTGTTSGRYQQYVGIWEEMDNHGFRKDVPIERKGTQLKLKFDILAHFEMGYEYNTRQATKNYRVRPSDRTDGRIRVAAFADFGIINIMPSTKLAFYDTPFETIYDFPTYQMNHAFSTQDARSYWMRNLSVGIRLSFLFGFQQPEHCILCDPWRH